MDTRSCIAYLIFVLSLAGLVGFILTPPVTQVVVADIYLIAGQSNASGYAEHQQSYTSPIPSYMLNINNQWGQTYGFPISLTSHRGTVWTQVASMLTLEQGYPAAFIPSAQSGTSITLWQPGTPLYERLLTRAKAGGHPRLVLWWQGEADSWAGMSQADYAASFETFVDALWYDLHTPILPALLQQSPLWDNTNVNAAILEVAARNSHVLPPIDLRGLHTDDDHHIMTDANLQAAATLWVEGIRQG